MNKIIPAVILLGGNKVVLYSSIVLAVFVLLLALKRFKPKFLYDTLSMFYKRPEAKEDFKLFDDLQRRMKGETEKAES